VSGGAGKSVEIRQFIGARTRVGDLGGSMTNPSTIPIFQRFFRAAAHLVVDGNDVQRFSDFVDELIDELVAVGRKSASADGRDVIEPHDLGLTDGIQERIREFGRLDDAEEIRDLLARTIRRPPGGVTFSDETKRLLPELFGGLSVALARSLRIIDPELTDPQSEHWERAFSLFQLLI
jgi:hypothetical protein